MPRASLSEQLASLLAYRNRPEHIEPLQTNWQPQAAANDNNPEDFAGTRLDRRLEVVPSVAEIMRQVNEVDENGEKVDNVVRNDAGQIVAIGTLRFSDGTQTERVPMLDVDEKTIIMGDIRMPVGAMLGCVEKADKPAGNAPDPTEATASNAHFAAMFGVAPRARRTGKRQIRSGQSYSVEEARAMLAAAYAATPVLPPVKLCPPGLPAAGRRIAESFLGCQKGRCAGGGSIGWVDIAGAIAGREVWAESMSALTDADVRVLDRALDARNLSDIDPGGSRQGAAKRGKRRLLEVAARLDEALRAAA